MHPSHTKQVVRLCDALRKIPGVGHGHADRVQDVLLAPRNKDLLKAVSEIGQSLVPYLGTAKGLAGLGKALKKHSPKAADHTYQTTLKRWVEESKS